MIYPIDGKKSVVFIGNTDDGNAPIDGNEAYRYARSGNCTDVYGIDPCDFRNTSYLNGNGKNVAYKKNNPNVNEIHVGGYNFTQICSDCVGGLGVFAPHTIDIIDVNMVFDLFPKEEQYASEFFRMSKEKLALGGKLMISLGSNQFVRERYCNLLRESGFNVDIREFEPDEYDKTQWTRDMKNNNKEYRVFLIVASKPN